MFALKRDLWEGSPSTGSPLPASTTMPASPNHTQPTSDMCAILQNAKGKDHILTCNSALTSQLTKQVRVAPLDFPDPSKPAYAKRTVGLDAVLNREVDNVTNRRLALDRKQRFRIAAALTWAVLHLCDSPWLDDAIHKDAIQLFLEQDTQKSTPRLSMHPYLSYSFIPPPKNTNVYTATNQFQSNQIQNITLYTLAIRLIELGLNKSFDKIRQEYNATSPSGTTTITPVGDYEVARHQITELMLDPGMTYAHAVDRCLRFLFPGPTQMNTFEHKAFRRTFFADVVAPIQATYELIPNSFSQIVLGP
jgi:hypothetical protein